MPDDKATLSVEELSELFRKVDEVCQQAQKLRSELLARMNAYRERDQSHHAGHPPAHRRGSSQDPQ